MMKRAPLVISIVIFWMVIGFLCPVFAALPPELPGVEIGEGDSPSIIASKGTLSTSAPSDSINASWSAPSIDNQLGLDKTLLGMNRGALFVPRMTEAKMEPEILVISKPANKSRPSEEFSGETGSRTLLEPGDYKVFVGSGVLQQRLAFDVTIQEGRTTVLEPTWCGLVVQTLTKEGDLVEESYEIYQADNGESFGKGAGQPPERQKDLTTWILPAGLYRISRLGEDPLSLANYITIQLNPGQLTYADVVFDAETGNLVAGGVTPKKRRMDQMSSWTFGVLLGGSASLGTTLAGGHQQSDYWATLVDLRLSARYDHNRLYGYNEIRSRNSLQVLNEKDQDPVWLVTNDLLNVQSNWVFRIVPWIGPYTRIAAKSHLLKTEFTQPDDSVVTLIATDSTYVTSYAPGTHIRIQPAGFPLRLGEGTGGSLHWSKGTHLDIMAQSGFAWRQTWMRNVMVPLNTSETLFMQGHDQYDWGQENRLVIRARLGSIFTMELAGELFLPRFQPSQYQVEELSGDFRLALTRHIELSYIQELVDRDAAGLEAATGGYRFEWQHSVQLRFFYNL